MKPAQPYSRVCFNLIPGVGEYFIFPALTTSGPCEIMVFEGVPGGPMDCWDEVGTPQEHLAKSRWILDTFLPWEAQRCKDIALTDDNGILTGRFTPTVRKPVARLPSGRCVLGMADTVVLNDPITGQGSNNAAKCADIYLKSILDHDGDSFNAEWMQQTFDRYWKGYAAWATDWTNSLLTEPRPPHARPPPERGQRAGRREHHRQWLRRPAQFLSVVVRRAGGGSLPRHQGEGGGRRPLRRRRAFRRARWASSPRA